MKIPHDELPDIKPEFYDYNWVIPEQDIFTTNVFKQGYYKGEENILKAILFLMGLDINRRWEIDTLEKGSSVRSEITGNVQHGGVVYRGYLRNDPNWNKEGLNITNKYLFGNVDWFSKVVNKE
jgi:hypothetical protein